MTSPKHFTYRLAPQYKHFKNRKNEHKGDCEVPRLKDAELSGMFADANGIIFTADTEKRILYISPGWTKILGHDISEAEGTTPAAFLHPDDITKCRAHFEKLLMTRQPTRLEFRLRHRDGSWCWLLCSVGTSVTNGGELFFVGILTDITEQKVLEQALQKSEERFHKAFEVCPAAITISNLSDSRYIDVNEAFLRKSGWERHEVIGRTSNELRGWETEEDRQYILGLYRTHGYIHNELINFRLKSGIIRTCDYSGVLVDMGGESHVIAILTDIHQLKQANDALKVSEDKFSKAFNTSPIPMSISTLKEGRFIDVNEAFCRVVGYDKDEMLESNSLSIHLWVDLQQRSHIRERLREGEPVYDFELLFRNKSRAERVGLMSVENIEVEGRACILSILNDITDQKQAEEEIRYLSFHDRLTGLYNRAFFEEELKRLNMERQLPISIIMGDVNGLKLINDALGHHEGDQYLINVASAIREVCRTEDIVARWGGDEFIILLPCCDSGVATDIVERLKSTEASAALPIQTSLSLGLATKNHEDQDITSIIKEAEDKMYRNKLLENKSTRNHFLSSLEKTLWSRSHETEEHCERIKKMAVHVAEVVGLPASDVDSLRLLAALHDIGKIAIPNCILEKPGKLTPEEWETIKKHPEVGYRIALSSPEMAPIAEAVLHHHERWDGNGYPFGLSGQDIPFLSRLISIVDTYDVMVNGRPYQAAVSSEEAWAEIIRMSGSQFDPELVSIISTNRFK